MPHSTCDTDEAGIGTGIGGGVVVDGRLRFGPDGRAGEVGHQVVVVDGPPCGCGNRGCLESVANSAALTALAGRASADEVFAGATAGDARCAAAIDTVVRYLGVGIANLVTVLRPDRIVVGGGVSGAGDSLLAPLREQIARFSPLVEPDSYSLVRAELGAHAGAIRAALWAQQGVTDVR